MSNELSVIYGIHKENIFHLFDKHRKPWALWNPEQNLCVMIIKHAIESCLSKVTKHHADKDRNVLWAVIEDVDSLGCQTEYVGCRISIRSLN